VAATVAAHLRPDLNDAWALDLFEGLAACCWRYRFALAGGDLATGGTAVQVVVSLVGEGPTGGTEGGPWLRRGAQPGDALLVTGALGGSRGGKHLEFAPRLDESRVLRKHAGADVHAAIDISDGLARDVGHLCTESRCGVEIEQAALPLSDPLKGIPQDETLRHVLSDGEDFELLVAVAPEAAERLLADWDQQTPLTRIGQMLSEAEGRRLRRADGSTEPLPDVGYEHRTAD
jgi:thiamine-monophosphate kinase